MKKIKGSQSRDISERKRTDEAIKASAEFRDSLISSMQDGFSVLDATGVQLEVNPALCQMTGFSREELVGKTPPFPYWPPEHYEKINSALQQTLKGNLGDYELIFLHKNGERFPVIVSPSVITNNDGIAINYLATVKDITVRKHAEAALFESEERYKLLAENTDDIVGLNDTNGNRLYISPSYFRKTGWTPEDVQKSHWRFRIHPDDIEIVEQARQQNLSGNLTRIEHRTHCKDGTWLWFETSCKPLLDSNGKVWRLLVWSHDITARKTVEAALRQSEQQFRAIFEQAAVGVAVIDSYTGRFISVNQKACQIARLSTAQLLKGTFMAITHPEDLRLDLDNMEKLKSGEIRTFTIEKRYLHPDGEITWINLTVSPMWQPNEKPTTHIAVVNDITDRKRAEDALRTANQKLRLHFEQTPMGVIEWDLNFCVTRWNPAAEKIFGYSAEEAIGRHAAFIVPQAYRLQVDDVWIQLLKQKGGDRSTNENIRKDGNMLLCEWYNTPLIDEKGDVTAVASLVLDITEQKQAQEALQKSEERYARAIRGSDEGLWDWSISTSTLYLSQRWKELLDYREDELPNHPDSFFTLLHPEDVVRVNSAVQAHLMHDAPYDVELRLRAKDGNYRWFRSRGVAERDAKGEAVRMAGTISDITARKQTEEKYAVEQEFNRALVSHTSALIVVLDEQSRIIHVNPAFEKGLGYDLKSIVGRPLWDTGMMSAAEVQRAKARYQMLHSGQEILPVELRLLAKDGTWHTLELHPTAARHSDGRLDRIILTFTDTTEKNRMQRELLKISEQEQARIGHNLHDGVGQTMTGLASLMESLENELTGAQRASATRIREILQDALQEVRRMSHGLSPASVKNRGLIGSLLLLADTIRLNHRTACTCELDANIRIDDLEKEMHVFRIAQEASNNAIRHGHPKNIKISLRRISGDECMLIVANDGAQMPKKRGKTSEGIGLQVMDYRANLIGGILEIASKPKVGVTISCRFPCASAK